MCSSITENFMEVVLCVHPYMGQIIHVLHVGWLVWGQKGGFVSTKKVHCGPVGKCAVIAFSCTPPPHRKGADVLLNSSGGHILRTKTVTTDEGGVAMGAGSLDSPNLVPSSEFLKLIS